VTRDTTRQKAQILCRAAGGGDYSWSVAVDLGVSGERFEEDPQNARNGNVVALLEWGHGAATFSAEVDFKRGSKVTLVASSVKVSAFCDIDGGVDDGTILSANVTAALIWGTRGGASRPTRTQFRSVPTGADGIIVPIPDFAERLVIASEDPDVMSGAAGSVTARLLAGPDAGDRVLLAFDNSAGYFRTLLASGGAVFPEGARYLQIVNGGDDPVPVSAVWGLAL
jgi:hypothetical protein